VPEVSTARLAAYTGAALLAGAAAGLIFASLGTSIRSSGSDDQPPIVVSDGSIYLNEGDPVYPYPQGHDWENLGSSGKTTTYGPLNSGAPPKAFEIFALNVIASNSCPIGPMIVDHVDLTYSGVANDPTPTAKIYIGKSHGKAAPVFETSLPMNNVAGSGSPGQLNYTTDGVLAGFVTVNQKGVSISCAFDPNNKGHAYLRVQPTK
jgi:hypothetical protein